MTFAKLAQLINTLSDTQRNQEVWVCDNVTGEHFSVESMDIDTPGSEPVLIFDAVESN